MQLKGRSNKKPWIKYNPYIADMLILKHVSKYHGVFDDATDFHFSDLNGDAFKRLIEAMPELLEEEDVLLKAFTYDMVNRDKVNHLLDKLNDVSIQDDKTVVYVTQRNVSSLTRVIPIDFILPFFFNDAYKTSPGDFIYKVNWKDILPKEEFMNAMKYFAKDLNIAPSGRYLFEVVNALYSTTDGVKQIVDGTAEILKKYNRPYIYTGDSEHPGLIDSTYYFEDEFLKIELPTDSFLDLFITYIGNKGAGRSITGATVISESQDLNQGEKFKIDVSLATVIDPIQREVRELLRTVLTANVQTSQSETEVLDFFGDDYEENIDLDKKIDNVLQGIQYEQRRYSRGSGYHFRRR